MLNEGPLGLTDREYKVMDILWDSDRDLTINEISDLSDNPKLTAPCISQVMPRLLKKGLIHVEKFIPVNTKYARTFLPDITRQNYMEKEMYKVFRKTGIKSILTALVHLNDSAENDKLFRDLETFIQDYKRSRKG